MIVFAVPMSQRRHIKPSMTDTLTVTLESTRETAIGMIKMR